MAARSMSLVQRGNHSNDTYNPPHRLESSPSKERQRKLGRSLRSCLIFLSVLLAVSLLVSQTLFWTRRKDLESALEYALDYAKYAPNNQTITSDTIVQHSSLTIDSRRNENRSMQVYNVPQQCETTIVTAYFQLKSKFSPDNYNLWMRNMLSMQDCMVIFTSPDLVETMQQFRHHATNRTVIISMPLNHLPMAQDYSTDFWNKQFDIDPEKKIHQGYPLFWIWLSKSWFVMEAITENYFGSQIFMWSDIGCFRMPRYRNKQLAQHIKLIPRHSILQMAHHTPNPPPTTIWNDKYRQRQYFYHSGSQAIGHADTWREFHAAFLTTIQEFISREMFLGEDQTVLQSTCLSNPNLCAYLPFDQVPEDNHYFGLRHALYHGGNYTYWRPPGANVREEVVSSVPV